MFKITACRREVKDETDILLNIRTLDIYSSAARPKQMCVCGRSNHPIYAGTLINLGSCYKLENKKMLYIQYNTETFWRNKDENLMFLVRCSPPPSPMHFYPVLNELQILLLINVGYSSPYLRSCCQVLVGVMGAKYG